MKYIKRIIQFVFITCVCAFLFFWLIFAVLNDSNSACNGMPDRFLFGDSISHDGVDYHLYFRTLGFQKKTVYFEVYAGEPVFDACNQTEQETFFYSDYDDFEKVQYVKDFVLRPNGALQDETVKVTYTDDQNEGFANVYNVKFTGVEE